MKNESRSNAWRPIVTVSLSACVLSDLSPCYRDGNQKWLECPPPIPIDRSSKMDLIGNKTYWLGAGSTTHFCRQSRRYLTTISTLLNPRDGFGHALLQTRIIVRCQFLSPSQAPFNASLLAGQYAKFITEASSSKRSCLCMMPGFLHVLPQMTISTSTINHRSR